MWSHISVSKSPSSRTWTRPQASSSSPPAGSWNHIPLLPVISWWITVNSLPLSPTLHLSFSFPLQSYGSFMFLQWIHRFLFLLHGTLSFPFLIFFSVYIPLSCLFSGEYKSKEWRKYHFTISVSSLVLFKRHLLFWHQVQSNQTIYTTLFTTVLYSKEISGQAVVSWWWTHH